MCFPVAQASMSVGDALFTRVVKWKSCIGDLPRARSGAVSGRGGVRLAPAERLEVDLVLVLEVVGLAGDPVELQEVVGCSHAGTPDRRTANSACRTAATDPTTPARVASPAASPAATAAAGCSRAS